MLTTSQKLSTGVDARNVRHIVLMRPVKSMIEFKQIIGRGTRTFEGKDFFTIWDFVKAHENFNDSEWDGDPLDQVPPGTVKPPAPSDSTPPNDPDGEEDVPPTEKIKIKLSDGKVRQIAYLASTTYWGPDGKPISAQQFVDLLFGELSGLVADEDQLRTVWSDPDNRQTFLDQLSDRGFDAPRLEVIRRLVDAPDSDLFDVMAYILFSHHPKTRSERAEQVFNSENGLPGSELRDFLLFILKAYEANGVSELAYAKLGVFLKARYSTIGEGKERLGGLPEIKSSFAAMQKVLYAD